MKKTQIIATFVAAAIGTTLIGAGSVFADGTFRTLDEIKESGTINIGVFSDKSPFG
jgi:polar amino acid transport system substrate-binding protein